MLPNTTENKPTPFQPTTTKTPGETLNKDTLAGILQGFLGLLMIKVRSHISVGTPTDFCQDVTRLVDEHGISTVVFPWEAGTTHPSTQLTRVEKLMESAQSQVGCSIGSFFSGSDARSFSFVFVVVVWFSPWFWRKRRTSCDAVPINLGNFSCVWCLCDVCLIFVGCLPGESSPPQPPPHPSLP